MASNESVAAELRRRITDYLSLGGLFNPELAHHDKLRDLLIDCRDALEPLIAQLQPGILNPQPGATEREVALKEAAQLADPEKYTCEDSCAVGKVRDAILALRAPNGPETPARNMSEAEVYIHKCIDRVTEMRRLDRQRSLDTKLEHERDYYIGRVHRCDDILFLLGEYGSQVTAGELNAVEEKSKRLEDLYMVIGALMFMAAALRNIGTVAHTERAKQCEALANYYDSRFVAEINDGNNILDSVK